MHINLLINWKNSVIYGKMAVNYEEKSFMEKAPGLVIIGGHLFIWANPGLFFFIFVFSTQLTIGKYMFF